MSDRNRHLENPSSSHYGSDRRERPSYTDKYSRREDKDLRYSEDYDRRRREDRSDYDRRDHRYDDRRSSNSRREEERSATSGRDYGDDRRSSKSDHDDRKSSKRDDDVDDRYEQRYSSSRQRSRSRSRSRSPVYRRSANKSDSSSINNVSSKPAGIQLKLLPAATVSAVKPVIAPKPSAKVASIFNDDDDEPEEMPPEAKMRMKNIGRETPTSAGPNSFGKTKMGFCNFNQIVEKNNKL